ncbi:MAG: hypothetical protein KDC52_18590, partial [Ignavibacteriae bacterium]|nr:hypothetical protein [Ignavibacteriota bacterium]
MIQKLIKYILLFTLLPTIMFAQVGYVPVEDEIYNYLNRMNTLGIIENYNSFEIPKTRKDISGYLIKIYKNREELDIIDLNKLSDFIIEFEYELCTTLEKSESLIPNWDFNYLLNAKDKFLYKYSDLNNTSLFVNFVGKLDYLNQSTDNKNQSSILYRFGGEIRGSLLDKVGFYVNTTNGSFSGDKDLARSFS